MKPNGVALDNIKNDGNTKVSKVYLHDSSLDLRNPTLKTSLFQGE